MDGRTNGGAYGLVDLLCSPKAHTRKGHRKWMAAFLLQRWINRTALALLGSAKWCWRWTGAFLLKRWINCRAYRGLAPQTWSVRRCLNGHSNSASRHRQGDRRDKPLHPSQIAGGGPFTFLKEEKQRAWKDHLYCSPSPERPQRQDHASTASRGNVAIHFRRR